jgi:hypothetical protein
LVDTDWMAGRLGNFISFARSNQLGSGKSSGNLDFSDRHGFSEIVDRGSIFPIKNQQSSIVIHQCFGACEQGNGGSLEEMGLTIDD